jgi:hypothetical protein
MQWHWAWIFMMLPLSLLSCMGEVYIENKE